MGSGSNRSFDDDGSRALRGVVLALLLAALTPAAARAANWVRPQAVSIPGEHAEAPQLALDPSGNALAIWQRSNGNITIIQSAYRPAGGTWQSPLDLSKAGQNAREAQLAIDQAGEAVAVWSRYDGSNYIIQSAVKSPGGGWQAGGDVSLEGQHAEAPQLALDPSGNALAIWQRSNGNNTIIQSAYRPAGGTWQSPLDLSKAGQNAREAQLAIDQAGEAVAVWSRYDGSNYIIQSAVKSPGGGWQAGGDVSLEGQHAEAPQLALDPSGNALAIWQRSNGNITIIQSAYRPAGGTWQSPLDLSKAGQNAREAQLAIDQAGEAVAVWSRYDGSNYIIQSAVKSPGGGWQAGGDVSLEGQHAEAPQLALDPSGNALAIWQRSNGNNTIIQSAYRPAGGTWQSPLDLSKAGQNAVQPQVAGDPEGDVAAIWSRYEGLSTIIEVSVLDAAGPRLDSLLIPSVGAVRRPLRFSVAPFGIWTPVTGVSWSLGDGSTAAGASITHGYGRPGVYLVEVSAADESGTSRRAAATLTIFAKASASRYAHLQGRRALLRLHCPSRLACEGRARLMASLHRSAGSRRFGRRLQIGAATFSIPPGRTTTVPVPLSQAARLAVSAAGRKGMKAQLTGPGVKHRSVVLLATPRRH